MKSVVFCLQRITLLLTQKMNLCVWYIFIIHFSGKEICWVKHTFDMRVCVGGGGARVCVCVCMSKYVCVHASVCMCVYVCMRLCVCVCVCVCVCNSHYYRQAIGYKKRGTGNHFPVCVWCQTSLESVNSSPSPPPSLSESPKQCHSQTYRKWLGRTTHQYLHYSRPEAVSE